MSMVTVKPLDATLVLPAASVALAVRMCIPSVSAELVILQLPEPFATAEPNSVVPFVS